MSKHISESLRQFALAAVELADGLDTQDGTIEEAVCAAEEMRVTMNEIHRQLTEQMKASEKSA
jgi:methyl-accepting chemotaxis protein